MVVATVALAAPEVALLLMLAAAVVLEAIAVLVVLVELLSVALVKTVPLVPVGEEAVGVAAAVRTPLALAVVSACLVRALTAMVERVLRLMALADSVVLAALTPLKLVQLLQVTSIIQVTFQGQDSTVAVVVVLITQLLNKLTAALVQCV
jgi:hypothetical protein